MNGSHKLALALPPSPVILPPSSSTSSSSPSSSSSSSSSSAPTYHPLSPLLSVCLSRTFHYFFLRAWLMVMSLRLRAAFRYTALQGVISIFKVP